MDKLLWLIHYFFPPSDENDTLKKLKAEWERQRREDEWQRKENEAQEKRRKNEEEARRNEEERRTNEEEKRRVEEDEKKMREKEQRRKEEAEEERRRNEEERRRVEQEQKMMKAKKRRAKKERQKLEKEKRKFEEEKRASEQEERCRREKAEIESRERQEAERRNQEERLQRIEEQLKQTEEERKKREAREREVEEKEKAIKEKGKQAAEEEARKCEEDKRKIEEDKKHMKEKEQQLRKQAEDERQKIEAAKKEIQEKQSRLDENEKRIAQEKSKLEKVVEELVKEGQKAGREREKSRETGIHPLLWPSEADLQHAKEKDLFSPDKFGFAVAGAAGSGKSSLINIFLNLPSKHPNAAATGTVETTTEIGRYPDPSDKPPRRWTVWYDVPGAGTLDIPSEQYFIKQFLFVFDLIIVMIGDRLTQIDLDILENCQRFKIPSFIVRSKADQHIRNSMRDTGWDDESVEPEGLRQKCRDEYISEARRNIADGLKKANLPEQDVYLVSSRPIPEFQRAYSSFIGSSSPQNTNIDKKKRFIDEWKLIQDLWAVAHKRRGGQPEPTSGRETHVQITSGSSSERSRDEEINDFLASKSASRLTQGAQSQSPRLDQAQLVETPAAEDHEAPRSPTRENNLGDDLVLGGHAGRAYKQEGPDSESKVDKPTATVGQTTRSLITGYTALTISSAPVQN